MANLVRGMQVGAGLLSLGFGVYRLSQGQRDWMASTALTAGLTMAVTGMVRRRPRQRFRQIARLVNAVNRAMPLFSRTVLRRAPQMMSGAGSALRRAPRMMSGAGSALRRAPHMMAGAGSAVLAALR